MSLESIPSPLLLLIGEYVGLVRCRTERDLAWVRKHAPFLIPCVTFGNVIELDCAHVHLAKSVRKKRTSVRKRLFAAVGRVFKMRSAPNNYLVARPGQLESLTIKRSVLLNDSLVFQTNLRELHLVRAGLDERQAAILCGALSNMRQLESMDLNGNVVFNQELPAMRLGCRMRVHKTLHNIGLASIAIHIGYLWCAIANLPPTVRELNVSNNVLCSHRVEYAPSFLQRFRAIRVFHAWNTYGTGVHKMLTDAMASQELRRLSTPVIQSVWQAFGASFGISQSRLTFLTLANFEMGHKGTQASLLSTLRNTKTLRTLHVGLLFHAPEQYLHDLLFCLHRQNTTVRALAFDDAGLTRLHFNLLHDMLRGNARLSSLMINESGAFDNAALRRLGESLRRSVVHDLVLCDSFATDTKPAEACEKLLLAAPRLDKVSYWDERSGVLRRIARPT